MADNTTVNFGAAEFKSKVVGEAQTVFDDVVKAGRDFDEIVKMLETVWTTTGGKGKIDGLKQAKESTFDPLIKLVNVDLGKFTDVSANLFKMEDI